MPGPRIERVLAEQLADLSDELAGSLESGDSCAASQTAAQLRESVTQAINDGKVPEVYLEDLSGLANELEAQVPECVESPPPSDEDDNGDDKKKEKDKGEDDGEADEGTESIPTEPDLTPTTVTTTETTETTETESTTTTGTTPSSEDER